MPRTLLRSEQGRQELPPWMRQRGYVENPIRVDREHPRYERAAVRPSVDQVRKTLAKRYGLKVEDLMKGKRGKDNEPRKVGMYLAKELCYLKLKEIAEGFWDRELRHGGLGMSPSHLKDADGCKVSRSCKHHQTNLPTKRFDPSPPLSLLQPDSSR
jgi:hypothetical protein